MGFYTRYDGNNFVGAASPFKGVAVVIISATGSTDRSPDEAVMAAAMTKLIEIAFARFRARLAPPTFQFFLLARQATGHYYALLLESERSGKNESNESADVSRASRARKIGHRVSDVDVGGGAASIKAAHRRTIIADHPA